MALTDRSPQWMLGRVFSGLGLSLCVIGFVNSCWITYTTYISPYYVYVSVGLFKICAARDDADSPVCAYTTDKPGWYVVGDFLTCVGLFIFLVGVCSTAVAKRGGNLTVARAGAAMEAAAGVFGIVGAIVFLAGGRNYFEPQAISVGVGWSAIIFIIGCACSIFGAVLQAIHIAKSSSHAGYSERTTLLPN